MTKAEEKSSKKMRAIILAAGLGKRMRSNTAKVLHPVLGRPMLWHILKTLSQLNFQQTKLEQIHIVLGHNAAQIEEYLQKYIEKDMLPCPISCHIQEPQLGTGHAVMSVQNALKDFQGDILVLPGDCPLLSSETIDSLISIHQKDKADLSLLTTIVDAPAGYGRILKSPQGQILGIVEEKDASPEEKLIHEINPAVYCFNWPTINKGLAELKNNNKQGEYYLTDLIAWSVKSKYKLANLLVNDWREVMGINSRQELQLANKFLNERVINNLMINSGVTVVDPSSTWIAREINIGQDTVILPGCWLIGDINIGTTCTIGPHTSIEGRASIGNQNKIMQSHLEDCQIGNNCQIGPFSHIRIGTVLNNEVRIGNFVELKMSTIDSQTNVSHLSYIGDTKIGKDANVGAGTITANYDHMTKAKASTVIGDGSSIGSNSVLVAPIEIGKDSVIPAGTVVTKNVDSGALAVGRAKQENIPGWTDKHKKKNSKK